MDPRLYPFYNVAGLHSTNPIVRSRPLAACGSCLQVECTDSRGICNLAGPLSVVITDQVLMWLLHMVSAYSCNFQRLHHAVALSRALISLSYAVQHMACPWQRAVCTRGVVLPNNHHLWRVSVHGGSTLSVLVQAGFTPAGAAGVCHPSYPADAHPPPPSNPRAAGMSLAA
jgi:hypothetical protein